MTSTLRSQFALGVAFVALALSAGALCLELRAPSPTLVVTAPPTVTPEAPAPPPAPKVAYPPPPLTPEQETVIERGRRTIWEEAGVSWVLPALAQGPQLGPGRAECALRASVRAGFMGQIRSTVTSRMIVTVAPEEGRASVDERLRELLERAEQRVHAGASERARRLDLDGARGVVAQAAAGFARRGVWLQWVGFRERGGVVERVEVTFEAPDQHFARLLPTAQAMLYSFRFFRPG